MQRHARVADGVDDRLAVHPCTPSARTRSQRFTGSIDGAAAYPSLLPNRSLAQASRGGANGVAATSAMKRERQWQGRDRRRGGRRKMRQCNGVRNWRRLYSVGCCCMGSKATHRTPTVHACWLIRFGGGKVDFCWLG